MQGAGCRVQSLVFFVRWDQTQLVWGSEFGFLVSGCRVSGFGFRVSGCRVSGFKFRDSGFAQLVSGQESCIKVQKHTFPLLLQTTLLARTFLQSKLPLMRATALSKFLNWVHWEHLPRQLTAEDPPVDLW